MGVRIKKTPRNPRKRGCTLRIVLLAGLLALVPLSACNDSKRPPRQLAPTVVVDQPQEDEPGFDCRVHGNRKCGDGTD